MVQPFLSIVIPAHNEEHRIPLSLQKIHQFLDQQPYLAEVLVVENGSTDRTLALTQEMAADWAALRVFHDDRRGKGLAVQRGMLEARGEYRFICDADLSMPIEQVNRFLPLSAGQTVDVAIGSREVRGAKRYNEPAYRHLVGRVFNFVVRLIALPGLQDSQCGFKCFRASVAEDVFRYQTMGGWSFDVEVLYIARLHGYKISEVPIDWYFDDGSRIRVAQDSLRMFLDLLTIRRNAWRGRYG